MSRTFFTTLATIPVIAIGSLAVSACGSASASTAQSASANLSLPGAPSAPSTRTWSTDAMVFAGDGTWATEVTALEGLLTQQGLTYQEVSSAQLDAMSISQLTSFGVLIFPGGTGSTEAQSVSATTHANLRTAVQQYGVNYLGFCAGSFVAVAPAPASGQDVSYGFGVVNAPLLAEYAGPGTNADYEMTAETFPAGFPGGSTQNILWYGGPVTPNTGVIAKYPTGDPAISEMWSGNGFVVLSGPHPSMTQADLDSLGVTPDTPDQTLATQLISAALHQQPLPTF